MSELRQSIATLLRRDLMLSAENNEYYYETRQYDEDGTYKGELVNLVDAVLDAVIESLPTEVDPRTYPSPFFANGWNEAVRHTKQLLTDAKEITND